ncbi:hypothetical protein AZA_39130 [Nitrospirillum viridazoti Y2]|uniref:NACHT domain-containing protein n=1 Tax=Nitrospirillum amazonense TaxID=28077 RepID=A0A560IYU5_9PROT|nr:hypothetical protein AZA_39130 [Nitrospirillum amazonense Y2]TWB63655.1 NACHT domain-containing protein [Nitrospirillum amazonense]
MSNIFYFAERLSRTLGVSLQDAGVPGASAKKMQVGTVLWVFPDDVDVVSDDIDSLREKLSIFLISNHPEEVSLCRYVLSGFYKSQARIKLGHEVVSLKFSIRELLDVPRTLENSQDLLINEALSSLMGGSPIKTSAVCNSSEISGCPLASDAESLLKFIICSDDQERKQIFVEAEAGKGKTILLASVVRSLNAASDRLFIYVPLRRLPIQAGVGFYDIMQLIGVVGEGANRLEKAIQNGLVALFLDGIDEVSGRYDRVLIRDLLNDLRRKLSSNDATIVVSGRKTEARHLDDSWKIVGLDLPSQTDPDFRKYVQLTIDRLIGEWDSFINKFPSEFNSMFGVDCVDEQALREKSEIVDWILEVFPIVGKDPSLFFVQGLAAIGIGARIGNRKSLRNGKILYVPTIVDVCRSATVFACLREQSKVDDIARDNYSTEDQMATLRGFALLSSATKSLPSLPTPYEIAQKVFSVDPVNNNEVYTSIVRQNAKHALLYAAEGAAGSYRPKFLNDWIRNSFLAEVIVNERYCGIDHADIISLVATADRANLAFSTLLPDILDGKDAPEEFINTILLEARAGSEFACTNFWQLRASIGDAHVGGQSPRPVPLTQIDRAEFIGCVINNDLSGDSYFLDDSSFEGCRISNCILSSVSMVGVNFRSCELINIEIINQCEGPILFEGCVFNGCRFVDMISKGCPALYFVDCRFEGENIISQEIPAYGASVAFPLTNFRNCTSSEQLDHLLRGDWLQLNAPIQGIRYLPNPKPNLSVYCLRETLRAFFPSRVGDGGEFQARDYIRLTALGRGCLPSGSPGRDDLQGILESVGFATGGRSDHLYAPWSSVLGGKEQDRVIRAQMIEFMQDNDKCDGVISVLLRKFGRYFHAS